MNARIAVIGILVGTALVGPAFAGDLVVIVHADRDVRLTREDVAQIYLKRRRFWKNGEAIVPLNRDSVSPARQAFVRHVFGGDTGRLAVYWNRQYFRGVLPPATLASDEAMKRFVANEPQAIGYIPVELVDASVRVVLRIAGAPAGPAGGRASLVDGP